MGSDTKSQFQLFHLHTKRIAWFLPLFVMKVTTLIIARLQDPLSNHNDCQLTLAEASHAPDTKVLKSGESDKLITSPVCPVKAVVCWPVSISHNAL